MSEQSNSGIQVLENVLIKSRTEPVVTTAEVKSTPEAAAEKSDDALHVSVEKEISKLVQASDPISPATAVPTNEENPLSDDEEAKIILNLEVSSFSNEASIEETNDQRESESDINKKAMEQLDQLVGKKGRQKMILKDPLSITEVKAEQVTIKSEPSPKSPVKLHNRVLASSANNDKDILERVTISVEKPKKILNPLAPQPSNDDLVAILEGNDEKPDDDEEEHYEVVQIIGDSDMKESESTIVASVISKEEERKIALEQISAIPKNVRRRKRKQPDEENTPEKPSTATDMVKSLVSEWSDTDKDTETKSSNSTATKKIAPKKAAESEKKAFEPKIEPFKRTRIIKKKIIWDPDAPETQFSYASLVQSSAKKPKKLKQAQTPRKSATPPPKLKEEVNVTKGKRRSVTPTIINNKKKKLSEIDRLLGDEGAANMINSLENDKLQEKDSRPKKEQVSGGDKPERKEPVLKKRTPKPKSAAASWDYVYSQRNDDAMIVRRRSNSSYSSTTSPRRLSLEQIPTNAKNKVAPAAAKVPATLAKLPASVKVTAGSAKTTVVTTRGKNFEFAKPEDKKIKKEPERVDATIVADIKKAETRESLRKSSRTPVNVEANEAQIIKPDLKPIVKIEKIPDITVRKHGSVTELAIQSKMEKIKHTFTAQLMNEVVKQLELLKTDANCKVVAFTSAGQHFCQGIDFIPLTTGTVEKRKTAAVELATSVRNFLQALASFPKPLIAGISGACAGIGVTMLPLFDIVICSDKSTFETNYAKIGQLPEGNCILNLTNNLRHNFKTKMIWMCEKYTSTEAALSGLVTKLSNPNKLQADTILYAKRLASLSQQTFCSVKSQRQKADLAKLIAALAEEQKILAHQWISPECQEKFKQYLQKDCW